MPACSTPRGGTLSYTVIEVPGEAIPGGDYLMVETRSGAAFALVSAELAGADLERAMEKLREEYQVLKTPRSAVG
jgi:hypothetical protein